MYIKHKCIITQITVFIVIHDIIPILELDCGQMVIELQHANTTRRNRPVRVIAIQQCLRLSKFCNLYVLS